MVIIYINVIYVNILLSHFLSCVTSQLFHRTPYIQSYASLDDLALFHSMIRKFSHRLLLGIKHVRMPCNSLVSLHTLSHLIIINFTEIEYNIEKGQSVLEF